MGLTVDKRLQEKKRLVNVKTSIKTLQNETERAKLLKWRQWADQQ